jgi:mannitol-1-phosphate 5-dehydrogenase
LGHSAAAYIGHLYNPRFVYICEALSVPEVYQKVREAMLQSAAVLIKKYPDEFSSGDLGEHINDLLMRFQNKALGDTIFRCGCDLKRKLGPEDRLAGAIKLAMEFDLPYNKILYVLVCGCHFRATNENGQMLKGDAEFGNLYGKGLNGVLTTVCGFDETRDIQLFREAGSINNNSIVRSY